MNIVHDEFVGQLIKHVVDLPRVDESQPPISYEDSIDLVMKDGLGLRVVPQKFKTFELCRLAVEQNGLAICFVKKFVASKLIELWSIATRHPTVFEFVEPRIKMFDTI